ncbi:MAG: hypothetical protein ABFC54_00485 [Thermoguttaceae bacterium]
MGKKEIAIVRQSFFVGWTAWFFFFPIFSWAAAVWLGAAIVIASDAKNKKKVAIPFDFVSTFDQGRYGQTVGEMIWTKLARQGEFVVPESIEDVRDYCRSHQITVSPATDLATVERIVRTDFDAQIGIWGQVERAPGAASDVYDLTIWCVDFSTPSVPKVVYQTKVRTRTVSEIPHQYVAAMLDALNQRPSADPSKTRATAEKKRRTGPSLVIGDFQRGDRGVPAGWEEVAGQQREPLGGLVRWDDERGNSANKVMRFTLDRKVAENEGVMYYSRRFPIRPGATYRFQGRWRSNGPAAKIFVKCYDEQPNPYGDTATKQPREVYRCQMNLKGEPNVWHTYTEDFTPNHPKYSPRWGRVMLYAYLKPGDVEFDDVVVQQIQPTP